MKRADVYYHDDIVKDEIEVNGHYFNVEYTYTAEPTWTHNPTIDDGILFEPTIKKIEIRTGIDGEFVRQINFEKMNEKTQKKILEMICDILQKRAEQEKYDREYDSL